jgi:hypothetical protein
LRGGAIGAGEAGRRRDSSAEGGVASTPPLKEATGQRSRDHRGRSMPFDEGIAADVLDA